jgi:hypothetical protein
MKSSNTANRNALTGQYYLNQFCVCVGDEHSSERHNKHTPAPAPAKNNTNEKNMGDRHTKLTKVAE